MHLVDSAGRRIVPPIRVLPGRLSVSRTFGDCVAKLERYGGNPGCVIATPEIRTFSLSEATDFILLGSDGVFDKLTNDEIQTTVFRATLSATENLNSSITVGSFDHVTDAVGTAVNAVIHEAMARDSTDNLSVILLVFRNYASLI